MNKLPCINCICLAICRSLMIKSFIDDYRTLCSRCENMRVYLNYKTNHQKGQISDKFFLVQDYIYIGTTHE